MATYTSVLRLIKQVFQDRNWHTPMNTLIDMVDQAFSVSSVAVAGSNIFLSANNNASDESRAFHLNLTGTPGATRTINLPDVARLVFIQNNTNATQTIKAGAGTGVNIPAGTLSIIKTDGATNVVELFNSLSSGTGALARVNGPGFAGPALADYIRFPAVQVPSAGANDLDDYEEGTWTPTLVFSGAAGAVTYNNRAGKYTKIGNFVIAKWQMEIAGLGGATGFAGIAGYPFVPALNTVGTCGNPHSANAMTGTVTGMYEILLAGQNQSKIVKGISSDTITEANFASAGMAFAGGLLFQV